MNLTKYHLPETVTKWFISVQQCIVITHLIVVLKDDLLNRVTNVTYKNSEKSVQSIRILYVGYHFIFRITSI